MSHILYHDKNQLTPFSGLGLPESRSEEEIGKKSFALRVMIFKVARVSLYITF
jgi:hypothetical protein